MKKVNQCYDCEPQDNQRQALIPIYEPSCDTGCGSTIEGCPDNMVPLYGVSIPNFAITVPAIDRTFDLLICEGFQVPVGVWIYIFDVGRFQVVAVTGNGRTLTVRNGCSNGSAIPGNQVPGFQKTGQHIFHPTPPPDCDLGFDGQVQSAFENMSAEDLWCLTNPPLATDNEKLNIFGLTAACDPGDCPQQPDPNCLKKSPFVGITNNSVTFRDGIAEVNPELSDDECKIIGPLVEIENGDESTKIARAVGGLTYFPASENGDLLIDEKSFTNTDGFESITYPIQTAPFVPECAKYVELRGWVSLDPDIVGSGFFETNVYVTGPGQSTTDVNNKVFYLAAYENTAGSFFWTKKVKVTQASKLANLTFQVLTAGADEGTDFKYGVYIVGYWM